jgi:hypothetical protein
VDEPKDRIVTTASDDPYAGIPYSDTEPDYYGPPAADHTNTQWEYVPPEILADIPADVTHDVTRDIPSDVTRDVTAVVTRLVPRDTPRDIPRDIPQDDNDDPPDFDPDEYDVQERVRTLRIIREAKRRLDGEDNPPTQPPAVKPLKVLLDEPDTTSQFRIAGLMPMGGRIICAAQFKAGKTTLGGNLVRSLVDGHPFLGQFEVLHKASAVTVIDTEMSPNLTRRWLRDQNITNVDAVVDVISLRGQVTAFDIFDRAARQKWAERLSALGCDYLILDCLRPILDAFGLDENRDFGRFAVAFDALLNEAGIGDATVFDHMGHNGERARGDSRKQDWADAIWAINRARNTDGTDDPTGLRYFTALGRDVNIPEGQLVLDVDTRHLTLAGGSRTALRNDGARRCIITFLTESARKDIKPNKTAIETAGKAGGHPIHVTRHALTGLIKAGLVAVEPGLKDNSKLHTFAYPCAECGMPVATRRTRHESCPKDVDELVLP